MERNPKEAVIYARYSSEKQNEDSIERQLQDIDAFAKANDLDIVDQYIDRAQSGRTDQRPNFQRMIRDSKNATFSKVLVSNRDRFFRNVEQASHYEKLLKSQGIELISVTQQFPDDASGILQKQQTDSFNEYFSNLLKERVPKNMRIKANRLQYLGGNLVLGYKAENGRIVLDEDAAPIVQEIYERFARGEKKTEIMAALNERNIRTKTGKIWKKNSLDSILGNRRYLGEYRWSDVVFEDAIPSIISPELFQRVVDRMPSKKGGNNKKVRFLLKDKIYCGLIVV